MRKVLTIAVLFCICFVSLAYAGLEETNRWYEDRSVVGTWTLSDGMLKVSDVNKVGFYVCTNLPVWEDYTLKLKAKIDNVNNQNEYGIVIYFGGSNYQLILNGKGTITSVYNAIAKVGPNITWELLWQNTNLSLDMNKWYEIEILKYKRYIEVRLDGKPIIGGYDANYESGWSIGLGGINSDVWFDDVEILPSITGKVKDTNGIPIPDVKIIVFKDSSVVASTTTKSDGSYVIYGLSAEVSYNIKVYKFGYKEVILENQQINPRINPTITFSPSLEPIVGLNDVFCYPNPAKGIDKITFLYNLETPGKVKIKIYNIIGELVDELEDYKVQGCHTSSWNISNIASGIYIYSVYAETEYKKIKFKPKKLGIIK